MAIIYGWQHDDTDLKDSINFLVKNLLYKYIFKNILNFDICEIDNVYYNVIKFILLRCNNFDLVFLLNFKDIR